MLTMIFTFEVPIALYVCNIHFSRTTVYEFENRYS